MWGCEADVDILPPCGVVGCTLNDMGEITFIELLACGQSVLLGSQSAPVTLTRCVMCRSSAIMNLVQEGVCAACYFLALSVGSLVYSKEVLTPWLTVCWAEVGI